jgi:hypothetical protein
MGFHYAPIYGELDLGSAIEKAEKLIAKIKSNKFDKKDLEALEETLSAIHASVEKYED